MRDTRSSIRAPLWLAAGLIAGFLLSPMPAATQSEITPAALEALTKRLEALEERLGGETAKPAEGGLVIKAPFKIVNEQGQEVFSLEAEGTKVEANVGIGEVKISMETAGQDGAKLEVAGGLDRSLELSASPGESKLEITNTSSAEVAIGALEQGETGIEISAGGQAVFEVKTGAEGESLSLGAEAGKQAKLEAGETAALTLGEGEAPAVELVALEEGGELALGSGQEPVVTLSAAAGDGVLELGAGEEPVVALGAEGDEGKLTLGSGEPAATLSGKGEAGSLLLGKENGKLAKLDTEGAGGLLELSKGGEPQVKLEAASEGGALLLGPGGEPTLKLTSKAAGGEIFIGEPEGKKIQIGTPGGTPVIQVSDGDKRVSLTVGEVVGTLATSPDGSVIVGQGPDGWGVILGKQGSKLALLGSSGQQKMGLTLYSNNSPTTVLKANDDGGTLTFGVGGQPKVTLKSNEQGGEVLLGNTDAVKVQIGTRQDAIVQLTKSSDRVVLVASGETVGMTAKSSEGFIEAGKGSKGFGFTMTNQGQPMLNLGFFEGRPPALRVFYSGAQIAAVGPGHDGGGTMRVFPAGGGNSLAQMDAFASGGYIGAFFPNGSPAAALDSNEHVVAVYNSAGMPVATLGIGSNGSGGNVTTRDSAGNGVFSAGATQDGGTACVIHKGKIHCLGIGLPLMGGGN